MRYSELFNIGCATCSERNYEWAIRPPLWESISCWTHLPSYEKRAWKNRLLCVLHSQRSLRRPHDDFRLFQKHYMKTGRKLLKQYGYNANLLKALHVSSFSELEEALQSRLNDQQELGYKMAYPNRSGQSIVALLRDNWLKESSQYTEFISLEGVDLSGEDLSKCTLDFIVFDGANLSNANLTSSILSHSILSHANIKNATLDDSNISCCSFENADLTGSSLLNAHGESVRFGNARLLDCNASLSNLERADFRGTEVDNVDLTSARLQHSDLSSAILRRCSLQGAQMTGANFTDARLIDTRFHDLNCSDATFVNADLANTDLRSSNLSRSDFTDCNLENAVLRECDLEGANVTRANLRFADLRNANFHNVDLYKAKLERTRIIFEDAQSFNILAHQLRDGSLAIERANKTRIFISYSHADSEFAMRLEDALRDSSIDVWIDRQEILPGDSLIEKIREGIDASQYVCAVLSNSSINSKWVRNELDIAMNQQIENGMVKVIPLVLEENLRLPSFLVGKRYRFL